MAIGNLKLHVALACADGAVAGIRYGGTVRPVAAFRCGGPAGAVQGAVQACTTRRRQSRPRLGRSRMRCRIARWRCAQTRRRRSRASAACRCARGRARSGSRPRPTSRPARQPSSQACRPTRADIRPFMGLSLSVPTSDKSMRCWRRGDVAGGMLAAGPPSTAAPKRGWRGAENAAKRPRQLNWTAEPGLLGDFTNRVSGTPRACPWHGRPCAGSGTGAAACRRSA